jgi:hypothetical protein
MRSKILLISTIAFIFGLIGYFAFFNQWIRYIFAHVGALGIISFFAWLAGNIAAKKGLNVKRAVLLGFFPPVILGIIAVYIVGPPKEGVIPSSCGGIVSLAVALTIVIIYLARKSLIIHGKIQREE